jgi:hypothetical protein
MAKGRSFRFQALRERILLLLDVDVVRGFKASPVF